MGNKTALKAQREAEVEKERAGDPTLPAGRSLKMAVVLEADADGRRVRLVAKDEIVLECGKASITLRRNGRVVVRGTQLETNAEGTDRIKGGHVAVN
jgi:uncharacterized protein (DUF2345 family)